MNRSLSEEHPKDVVVLFKLVILLRVSVSVLGPLRLSLRPEPIIVLFFFRGLWGLNRRARRVWRLPSLLSGSKRTFDLVFVWVESESQRAICLFDLGIAGWLLYAQNLVVVLFGQVGSNLFLHLLLFFIAHCLPYNYKPNYRTILTLHAFISSCMDERNW